MDTTPPYTSKQVAARFNVTVQTVARWARNGRLPAFKTPTGGVRFRVEDVEKLTDPSQKDSAA